MMERLTIDPASWSRTCLTETNEYLMTIAGVMVKAGYAAERHVDTLRVNLGSIQPSSGAENLDPPLLTLSRKNCEFVQLLDARYGYDRLVLNLFHYSAKNWIHSTAALLNRWGQLILKNSDLVLNRVITIYRPNEEPADQRLFSELLVEMAERIERCTTNIERAGERIDFYYPATGVDPETRDTETVLARQLGLSHVGGGASPGLDEEDFIRSIALEIISIAKSSCLFADQIAHNLDREKSVILKVRSQWLQSEANRLFNFCWPSETGLVAMEIARNQSLMILSGFTAALADMESEFQTAFPGSLRHQASSPVHQRTESLRGRLIADAMIAGMTAKEARDSVVALISYAEKYGISAAEMIPGELNKIHSGLMPRTLEKFQEWTQNDPLAQTYSTEKARSSSRSAELTARFQDRSQRLSGSLLTWALIGFFTLTTFGCGLKTRPKSDADDLRPAIPFHSSTNKISGQNLDTENTR